MDASSSMTRDVTVIPSNFGLHAAYELMQRRRMRHLLVVRGGALVGILSDRDVLLHATPGSDGAPVVPASPVANAMTPHPITCEPTTTVAELAKIMIEHKIDAVPVLNGPGRLVGLVTSTDLLALLIERRHESGILPFRFRLDETLAEAG